jgi:hypothetical protein
VYKCRSSARTGHLICNSHPNSVIEVDLSAYLYTFTVTMRFQLFALQSLCLVTNVFALPASGNAQDTAVITKSLQRLDTGLNRLSLSLRAITPRLSNFELQRAWGDVQRDSRTVTDTLSKDSVEIRRAPQINLLESASLLSPINSLQTLTSKVIDQWIAIRPVLSASDRKVASTILKDHESAAGQYADAILSRQSGISTPVGRLLGSELQSTIEKGVSTFRY